MDPTTERPPTLASPGGPSGHGLRRPVFTFCANAYGVLTFPAVVPPLLMLVVASTLSGRLFATACLAGWLAGLLALRALAADAWRPRAAGAVTALLVAVASLLICHQRAPAGDLVLATDGPQASTEPSLSPAAEEPEPVSSVPADSRSRPGSRQPRLHRGVPLSVVSGSSALSAWSPARLVPEVDQFTLGSWFVAAIDPFIDLAESRRVRHHFQDVYQELALDPGFARLPSSMPIAYADLMGRPRDIDHTFVYLPRNEGTGPRPVLLYLHGSLGSFQAYLWVLKPVADRTGWAIVAPTFGAGFWARPDGASRVEQVLDFIQSRPELDASRIVVSGLSNGGLGVTRAAIAHPQRFEGLVYFSPVIEPELVGGASFSTGVGRRPVLVLHGEEDDRIPAPIVEDAVLRMQDAGIPVTYHHYPGEEHWLFFSQRRELADVLSAWLPRSP